MEASGYAKVRTAAMLIAGSLLCMGLDTAGNKDKEDKKSEAPTASRWLLLPAQDESSVEKEIAEYLKEKEGTEAILANIADEGVDLVCLYAIAPEAGPRVLITIDTHVARVSKETRKITARCIEVSGHYKLPDSARTPASQVKLLDLMNTWHQTHFAPGHICLDQGGNLELATHIVIPAPDIPVHAEMVRDALYRIATTWGDFYAQMAKTVDLPTPEAETSLRPEVPPLLKRAAEHGDAVEWRSTKHRNLQLPLEPRTDN